MTMKKEILSAIGLLLLLGACTPNDNDKASTDSAMLRISSARLGGNFTRSDEELTRGSLGICLQGNEIYTAQTNVPYTYASGSGWTSQTPVYLSAAKAVLAAYYPYSETGVDNQGLCALTSGAYSQAGDVCYARDTLNSASASWSVSLNHACALVSLNITRKSTYFGAGVVSRLDLLGENGLNTSGKVNLFTDEYSEIAREPMLQQTLSPSVTLTWGDSYRSSFLLLPMPELTGRLDFTVEVDGKNLTTGLDPSAYHLPALAAGNEYVFNLTIDGTALSLDGVSVRDWRDVSVFGTTVLSPAQ